MEPSLPSTGSSRLEAISAIAGLALFAAALILMAWAAVPPLRKTRMRLALLRLWRRALSQHARRTAVRSMALELATGRQDYEASYRLALAVDRIDARMNLIRAGLS
jgi:hypothetical protein